MIRTGFLLVGCRVGSRFRFEGVMGDREGLCVDFEPLSVVSRTYLSGGSDRFGCDFQSGCNKDLSSFSSVSDDISNFSACLGSC